MHRKKGRESIAEISAHHKQRTIETFNALCEAARKADNIAVYKILTAKNVKITHVHLDEDFHDKKSVLMQMAQEDNTAAVDMLINEFNMNPEDAIEGYARAKRGDLVTSLLQKHKGGDRAIRAYAYTGQVDAMNVMLNFGASMRSAAYGAGRAGNIELLHDLISRSNARINVIKHAMSGLIHSDHIDDAEALIFHCIQIFDQIDDAWRDALNVFDTKESHVKKTDHLPDLTTTAIEAYSQAHYFSDEFKLTKLLASTKDQKIFNVFAHFAKQISSQNDKYNFRGITTAEIIHKASLLRLAMLDKKISFDEALTSGIANAKPDPKPTLLSRIHLFKKPAAVNAQPAVMSPASAEATPATDSTVNAEAATEAASAVKANATPEAVTTAVEASPEPKPEANASVSATTATPVAQDAEPVLASSSPGIKM